MNYIKFYIEEEKPVAKICKNGKILTIRRKKNINELLNICSKYNHKITKECTLKEDVLLIAHDYEEYKKKEKRQNIQVVGEIKPNMKVKRKNVTLGKIVVVTTLTALISSMIINSINSDKETIINDDPIQYETQVKQEEKEDTIELIDGQNIAFKTSTSTDAEPINDSYELQEGEDIVDKIETDSVTINIIGDENENKAYEEINEKNELTNMLTPVDFHFTCDEAIDINAMNNVKRYDDIFEKYARDFGVDKEYLEGKAAQETNGNHYENIEGHPAIGLMQIERANFGYFNDGTPKSITAYNFTTGEWETVELTDQSIAADLETNIKLGAMFSQAAFQRNNYNILVGTQEYNMGCGNMDNLMATCSSIENISTNDLRNNLNNQEWLKYRESVGAGDPKYIEHVFRYLPDDYTIKIKRVDNGEYVTLTIHNDTEKNIQK